MNNPDPERATSVRMALEGRIAPGHWMVSALWPSDLGIMHSHQACVVVRPMLVTACSAVQKISIALLCQPHQLHTHRQRSNHICLQGFGFNDPKLTEVNMVGSDVTIVGEITSSNFQSDAHGSSPIALDAIFHFSVHAIGRQSSSVEQSEMRTRNLAMITSASPRLSECGHYHRVRERQRFCHGLPLAEPAAVQLRGSRGSNPHRLPHLALYHLPFVRNMLKPSLKFLCRTKELWFEQLSQYGKIVAERQSPDTLRIRIRQHVMTVLKHQDYSSTLVAAVHCCCCMSH